MQALGTSLPASRIAGGIVLLLAIDVVMARQTGRRATTPGEDSESTYRSGISVFSLAIPLIAGPVEDLTGLHHPGPASCARYSGDHAES